METKLERISQLSKENPNMVFTSIGHLINKEMLKKCHETMQKDKATGIDGITKEEYGKHLEENLEKLVERLKNRSYKPKPARRVEIPKPNGKTRPLSIYCYEDKLGVMCWEWQCWHWVGSSRLTVILPQSAQYHTGI